MLKRIRNKIFLVRKKDSNCFFKGPHVYHVSNCLFILFSKEGIHLDCAIPGNADISNCIFESTKKLKERWGIIQEWEANGAVYDDFASFQPSKEEVIQDKIVNKDW